ncbi:hypothetical protein AB1Y20_001423 [Prymnesium parvum]|uniref:Secreted protein n=1 Tax=Prymnesium parvum TaxID=97485 RepID=A0AB34KBD0_PRYPA
MSARLALWLAGCGGCGGLLGGVPPGPHTLPPPPEPRTASLSAVSVPSAPPPRGAGAPSRDLAPSAELWGVRAIRGEVEAPALSDGTQEFDLSVFLCTGCSEGVCSLHCSSSHAHGRGTSHGFKCSLRPAAAARSVFFQVDGRRHGAAAAHPLGATARVCLDGGCRAVHSQREAL